MTHTVFLPAFSRSAATAMPNPALIDVEGDQHLIHQIHFLHAKEKDEYRLLANCGHLLSATR